jgi:hypothetical protein
VTALEDAAADAAAAPVTVRKAIGVTHADFLRMLPEVLGSAAYRQEGAQIVQEAPGKRLEIVLAPQEERRLGSLRLPLTRIELVFRGHTPAERAALLESLQRAFMRSGG